MTRESAGFALHGSNFLLEFIYDGMPVVLDIEGGRISQVIQNLVINAYHAMSNGGTITVALEDVEAVSLSRFGATCISVLATLTRVSRTMLSTKSLIPISRHELKATDSGWPFLIRSYASIKVTLKCAESRAQAQSS